MFLRVIGAAIAGGIGGYFLAHGVTYSLTRLFIPSALNDPLYVTGMSKMDFFTLLLGAIGTTNFVVRNSRGFGTVVVSLLSIWLGGSVFGSLLFGLCAFLIFRPPIISPASAPAMNAALFIVAPVYIIGSGFVLWNGIKLLTKRGDAALETN